MIWPGISHKSTEGLEVVTISTKDLDALQGMAKLTLASDGGQQSRASQCRGQPKIRQIKKDKDGVSHI